MSNQRSAYLSISLSLSCIYKPTVKPLKLCQSHAVDGPFFMFLYVSKVKKKEKNAQNKNREKTKSIITFCWQIVWRFNH